jgi:ATP synthase F1 gamma subunit
LAYVRFPLASPLLSLLHGLRCVLHRASSDHCARCLYCAPLPLPTRSRLQESILNAVALPDEKRKDLTSKEKADDDAAKGIFLDDKKHLITVVTTDRGLCGAVNSSLTRALRKELNAAARAKSSVRLFVLGDKGRAQVSRDYVPIVARTIDSCFDKDPIFPLAAAIATKIVKEPYDILTLWYNHYENQVKFHNVYKKIPQLANMPVGVLPPSLKGYDIEPDNNEETLVNMQEYAVASALYFAMLETTACEASSTARRGQCCDWRTAVARLEAATRSRGAPQRCSIIFFM